MFLFQLWKKGLLATIIIIVVTVLIYSLIDLTQILEVLLAFVIPKEYIFWGLPFLIVFFIVPFIIGLLTDGKLGKFIGRIVAPIPLLNIIFNKEEDFAKQGIPAVFVLEAFNIKLYFHGLAMGINEINGNSVVCMFFPSVPVIFTGPVMIDVALKNVKEVKLIGEDRNSAIRYFTKKCVTYGTPSGKRFKLKDLELEKIKSSLKDNQN